MDINREDVIHRMSSIASIERALRRVEHNAGNPGRRTADDMRKKALKDAVRLLDEIWKYVPECTQEDIEVDKADIIPDTE